MVLSTSEYGLLYGQYKQAESDVLRWIRSVSSASLTGKQHCYSYHKVLAEKASSIGHVMPEAVQEKTKLAFLNRLKIAEDHLEKGESCEKHEFSIEMLRTFIRCFLPSEEAEDLASRRSTDFLSNSSQSSRCSTPTTEEFYIQPSAGPWEWQQPQTNYYPTYQQFDQGMSPMVQQMPYQQPCFEQGWAGYQYQYEPQQTMAPPGFGYYPTERYGAPVYAQDGCVYYA